MHAMHVAMAAVVGVLVLNLSAEALGAEDPATTGPLQVLRKMYLSVHALSWGELTPDDPRRQQHNWAQWPERCDDGYARDLQLRPLYEQLIRNARDDEGMFWFPCSGKPNAEVLELARQHFGPRLVVWNYGWSPDAEFQQGLAEDRQQAIANRGPDWDKVDPPSYPEGLEWVGWSGSKFYAVKFRQELEKQGYTFDPATVEFVAFGGDWSYCCATFPIHMAAAWDLAKGIDRRFDLIIADESAMYLKATPVDQNLPMPENIRLFIFKTAEEGPCWGRYVAQFWEGRHSAMDPPHVVEVEFPQGKVLEVNIFGWGPSRAFGTGGQYDYRDRIQMSVGCGGHTPYQATLVMAYDESLSLEEFRAALLNGKVVERTGAQ